MPDTETLEPQADTEPDDDEPDDDDEPGASDDDTEPGDDNDAAAAAPQAPEPSSGAAIEGAMKKLALSAQTFRRRVSDVLGEDAQFLVPCELCEPEIPGFHWPAEIAQARDDTHARLLEVLRSPAAPEYVAAPDVRRCDACKGYGKGQTGSLVPGQETKVCGPCRGFGYVPPPGSVPGEVFGDATVNGQPPSPVETEPQADQDPWGSPRVLPDGQLNPNYGRMPQYKEATLP